jgi:hypothetical protein
LSAGLNKSPAKGDRRSVSIQDIKKAARALARVLFHIPDFKFQIIPMITK